MSLIYPEHKHPHGPESTKEKESRIWVCTECDAVKTDEEIKKEIASGEWGYSCKSKRSRINIRCEAHFEPYVPDLKSVVEAKGEGK